ncbi:hypothetical protein FOZ63_029467 [Perkinsus olseni]|uniref:MULE transposase domain-containing protein n=1 Tax=Perkinsus olseni TaxID=32597 RepID=A0A7J6SQW6_PEROL|nr:hypothetical protein FOZ63_029467 [Perkinsus olseni]
MCLRTSILTRREVKDQAHGMNLMNADHLFVLNLMTNLAVLVVSLLELKSLTLPGMDLPSAAKLFVPDIQINLVVMVDPLGIKLIMMAQETNDQSSGEGNEIYDQPRYEHPAGDHPTRSHHPDRQSGLTSGNPIPLPSRLDEDNETYDQPRQLPMSLAYHGFDYQGGHDVCPSNDSGSEYWDSSSDDEASDVPSEFSHSELEMHWRFVPSSRMSKRTGKAGKILIIDGYKYWRRPTSNKQRIRYVCATQGCKATAYTDIANAQVGSSFESDEIDEILDQQSVQVHDHSPPDISDGWNRVLAHRIKEVIRETPFQPASVIYEEAVKIVPSELRCQVGGLARFGPLIYRQRAANMPPNPKSTAEVDFPDGLEDFSGEPFVLINEIVANERIVVLATNSAMHQFVEAKTWIIDGTFKAASGLFNQLLVFHKPGTPVNTPLVFAFLESRSAATYEKLMFLLHNKCLKICQKKPKVQTVISDFEGGFIKTFANRIGQVHHHLCLFHYSQSVMRRVDKLELTKYHRNNTHGFRTMCDMIRGLPFVPLDHLQPAWEAIVGYFENTAEKYGQTEKKAATKFLEYLNATYVSGDPAGNRPPLFPPPQWNASEVASGKSSTHRTSNVAEAFNRKINRRLGSHNQSFFFTVFILLELHNRAQIDLQRAKLGDKQRDVSLKRRDCERDLNNLFSSYFSYGTIRLSMPEYQRYMGLCAGCVARARNGGTRQNVDRPKRRRTAAPSQQ